MQVGAIRMSASTIVVAVNADPAPARLQPRSQHRDRVRQPQGRPMTTREAEAEEVAEEKPGKLGPIQYVG
jgi:hypothetical protein